MTAHPIPAFSALGAPLVRPAPPAGLPDARLLAFDDRVAARLGLMPTWKDDPAHLAILAGNAVWPDQSPTASVYAGHQFGAWVRQLGDGRAALIAELTDITGQAQQLQLKGGGPTAFARGGDGRAVLRSSLREWLASHAMSALGVPTTQALSLCVSDSLTVQRERAEPAAVLCRVAPSFVRFGHFEWLAFGASSQPPAQIEDEAAEAQTRALLGLGTTDEAHRLQPDANAWMAWRARLQPLVDHVIGLHFPHLAALPDPERSRRWLAEVLDRTSALVAHWQTLGFVHGVMNTDNMSILGLTLDYGPFGFMDRFRAHHVANASDHDGRYAWSAQPAMARWNCERLLHACAPLLSDRPEVASEVRQELIEHHQHRYHVHIMRRWRAKLGLNTERDDDSGLVTQFLGLIQSSKGDFTRSFRALSSLHAVTNRVAYGLRESYGPVITRFDDWVDRYRARLRADGSVDDHARALRMNRVNPLYVLRNHLAQQAIEATEAGRTDEQERLMQVLARPFDPQPGMEWYAAPPAAKDQRMEVSCSS